MISPAADKWIVTLHGAGGVGEQPGIDAFVAWARDAARADIVERAEVEWIDREAHAAHISKPLRFVAFASLWCNSSASADLLATAPGEVGCYRVRERLAYDRSGRPDEVRPWAGVKKTTFWSATEGVEDGIWQGRYHNHGYVAFAHHRTSARYRQNVILEGSDPALSAVSELWWTNGEDLIERFYADDDARRLVGIDSSGFVDALRAHPTVTTHEVLRTPSPM